MYNQSTEQVAFGDSHTTCNEPETSLQILGERTTTIHTDYLR